MRGAAADRERTYSPTGAVSHCLRLYAFALTVLQASGRLAGGGLCSEDVERRSTRPSPIAAGVLTDGQREVWELVIQGESQRAVGYRLDVPARTTLVDRFDAANRRLRARGVLYAADGQPYLRQGR